MRKNIIAASLAVAALAVLSCAKEADVKNSPAAKGVSIQVIAGEGATKTYVVDGDKVIINDEPDNALTIRDDSLVLDAPEMGEIVFTRK